MWCIFLAEIVMFSPLNVSFTFLVFYNIWREKLLILTTCNVNSSDCPIRKYHIHK